MLKVVTSPYSAYTSALHIHKIKCARYLHVGSVLMSVGDSISVWCPYSKKNLQGPCTGGTVSIGHGVTWILSCAHGQTAEVMLRSEPAGVAPGRRDC